MIKFEELIKSLILPLVAYPDDIEVILLNDDEDNLEYQVKVNSLDFGRVIGSMVRNLPASAGVMGSIPGGGRFHMPEGT